MFINLVLRKEQEVYRSEGVEWVHVEFQDNEPIYRMVEVRYMYVNCVSSDVQWNLLIYCLLYTSPSPRDATLSRMPSSA